MGQCAWEHVKAWEMIRLWRPMRDTLLSVSLFENIEET
jgi:hypothetical protein